MNSLRLFELLISNAIYLDKYSPSKLNISCLQESNKYLFVFKYSSIRSNLEQMPSFELNFIDKEQHNNTNLALSKKIISSLGGDIWIDSSTISNHEIKFTIPINSPSNKNTEEGDKLRNIALIENSQGTALAIKQVLAYKGISSDYNVVIFDSIAKILEGNTTNEIDLILLDLEILTSNKKEEILRIKKELANIPLIVFSSNASKIDKELSLSAGAFDYIDKDKISGSIIKSSIEKALLKNSYK